MPPGTGDVQMGVAKLVPRAEVIVVTTPAIAAQKVAGRAVSMARKSYLRVAGVIENMSAFTCDHGDDLRPVRRGRRRGAGRTTPASRCSARSRSSRASPPAATPASPSPSATGPAADAFRAIADAHRHRGRSRRSSMAGCSARMLDAAVAALDALDAAEASS